MKSLGKQKGLKDIGGDLGKQNCRRSGQHKLSNAMDLDHTQPEIRKNTSQIDGQGEIDHMQVNLSLYGHIGGEIGSTIPSFLSHICSSNLSCFQLPTRTC